MKSAFLPYRQRCDFIYSVIKPGYAKIRTIFGWRNEPVRNEPRSRAVHGAVGDWTAISFALSGLLHFKRFTQGLPWAIQPALLCGC